MGNQRLRHVTLGVSGSVAAYKACELLRSLKKKSCDVKVVMTTSAQKLIGPPTFRALSGNPVYTSMWPSHQPADLTHINLAEWSDALVVVPATANIIAKFAGGLADDLLSTLWTAYDGKKLIAPAMNDNMWANPAVQRNVEYLKSLPKVNFTGPVAGRLASGKVGESGRLAPVDDIVKDILQMFP